MNLRKNSHILKPTLFITVILSVIPIIIYFYYVKIYAVNVPFWDDFPTVFNFLNLYLQTNSFTEKVKLIFSQQNEHRIVFNKIVVLTIYYLNKEVDLRVMMWVGNLSLIGITLLFAIYLIKQKGKIIYFLPIPFLLFQLQYHENMYWAMASVQNLYVVLFSIFSIYFITQTHTKRLNKYFFIAILFASIATFTSGNGIFTFIVINLILLYQGRKKELIIVLVMMVSIIFVYFYGYEKLTSNESILLVLRRPKRTILSFLYFLGGAAGGLDRGELFGEPYILLTGVAVLLWIIYLFFKKYYDNQPFIIGCFIFLLITATAATVTRSGYGQVVTLTPRYKIYSLLFVILSYIALIDVIKPQLKKAVASIFIIVSIMLNFSFYHRYTDFMLEHKKLLLIHMAQWKNYSTLYTDDFLAPAELVPWIREILVNAEKTDIYKAPQLRIKDAIKTLDNIDIKIKLQETDSKYLISSRYIPAINKASDLCVILKSNTQNYIFNIYRETNTIIDFLRTWKYYQSDLKAEFPKNQIQRGVYTISIYSITPEQITFIAKTDKILIKN